MQNKFKRAAKELLPEFALGWIRARNATWRGDYPSWESVNQECSGYSDPSILKKTDAAMQLVVEGRAAYSRDSVVFDHIEYSWPLLAGLLWSHSIQKKLRVLDFGGSLGSTYYQNKKFLAQLDHTWSIIDQGEVAKLGKSKYQTSTLKFYESIDECVKSESINTLLISSTLQYLDEPIGFLTTQLNAHRFPVVLLDRLSIIDSNKNRITKQTVNESIYKATLPCWFFSEQKIFEVFERDYVLMESFTAHPENVTWIDGCTPSRDRGYIFARKDLKPSALS